jgi:predicted RNA-binding protein with PUA-like domain
MVGEMGKFWLMKSEPDQFGIADLARVKIEPWTGVRSYFARAHLRAMSVDDAVLFHHSNATPPGVAGLAKVVRTGVIDETQFDPTSKYFDPKATRDAPIWDCVEVEYVATFPHFVAMDRIRAEPAVADMLLLRRGMRLSVQPVTEAEYHAIVALGQIAPPEVPKPVRVARAPRSGKRPAKRPANAAKRPANAAKAANAANPAKPAANAAKAAAKRGNPARSAKPVPNARPASSARGVRHGKATAARGGRA